MLTTVLCYGAVDCCHHQLIGKSSKTEASIPLSQIQNSIPTFITDTDWKANTRRNYRDIAYRLSAVQGPLSQITNVEFL
jgi:hypothetical protein